MTTTATAPARTAATQPCRNECGADIPTGSLVHVDDLGAYVNCPACGSSQDDETIMAPYIVLYRRDDITAPADPPFGFRCWAEDTEHAEEQTINAEPDADILRVVQTDNVEQAYSDYWNTLADNY